MDELRYGRHGIKSVGSASNQPGSRAFFTTWTDENNHLWMFGGFGCLEDLCYTPLDDLWRFDGSVWIWEGGAKNSQEVTGTSELQAL